MVKIGQIMVNVVFECPLNPSTFMYLPVQWDVSSIFDILRGHAKTTFTIFGPIVTTYLPPVDMFTE